MSTLEAIENEVRKLPREQALQLQDWLSEYLEDRADLTPEFVRASSEVKLTFARAGRAAASPDKLCAGRRRFTPTTEAPLHRHGSRLAGPDYWFVLDHSPTI
jgi:hypothetical protein